MPYDDDGADTGITLAAILGGILGLLAIAVFAFTFIAKCQADVKSSRMLERIANSQEAIARQVKR